MPNSLCSFQRVISACLTRHQPVRVAELTSARFKIKTPRAKRISLPLASLRVHSHGNVSGGNSVRGCGDADCPVICLVRLISIM